MTELWEVGQSGVNGMPPKLIASFLGREITFLASELPAWMDEALGETPYSTRKLREFFEQ
jgi:hypothetical protein